MILRIRPRPGEAAYDGWRASPLRNHARDRAHPTAGLTLVEVMVGMFVIGMSALAALAGLLFSLRVSDSNLCGLVAHATAVSVAEQVHALDYGGLDDTTLPIDIPSLPDGSLTVNTWNDRAEDIHHTPGVAADDLQLSIRPEIVRGLTKDGLRLAQVVIRYRWTEKSFFRERSREESVTFVLISSAIF